MGKYKSWGIGLFICLLFLVAWTIHGVLWWEPSIPGDNPELALKINKFLEDRQAMKREWGELCTHISQMF